MICFTVKNGVSPVIFPQLPPIPAKAARLPKAGALEEERGKECQPFFVEGERYKMGPGKALKKEGWVITPLISELVITPVKPI